MPFDAMDRQQQPVSDELAERLIKLGITPVPLSFAEQHRATVLAEFKSRGHFQTAAVRDGMARWRSYNLGRNGLRQELTDLRHIIPGNPADKSAAPAALIQLAEKLAGEIKDATFVVQYFDADPILNISCFQPLIGYRTACLGIWDQGRLLAIAGQNGEAPVYGEPERWWSSWTSLGRAVRRLLPI